MRPSRIEDAQVPLSDRTGAVASAIALAWLKASDVLSQGDLPPGTWVLAADTICESEGRMLGKPGDAEHARRMLELLLDREHRTVTGVCLVQAGGRPSEGRRLWAEVARVAMRRPSDALLQAHLDGGAWQGKAGGYSLDEVRQAGWSVSCIGDPEVVLGLPVSSVLRAIGHPPGGAPA